jgi:hypothetical protein
MNVVGCARSPTLRFSVAGWIISPHSMLRGLRSSVVVRYPVPSSEVDLVENSASMFSLEVMGCYEW